MCRSIFMGRWWRWRWCWWGSLWFSRFGSVWVLVRACCSFVRLWCRGFSLASILVCSCKKKKTTRREFLDRFHPLSLVCNVRWAYYANYVFHSPQITYTRRESRMLLLAAIILRRNTVNMLTWKLHVAHAAPALIDWLTPWMIQHAVHAHSGEKPPPLPSQSHCRVSMCLN